MSQPHPRTEPDTQHDLPPTRRPGSPLLWILLLLAVIALGIWYFSSQRDTEGDGDAIAPVTEVEQTAAPNEGEKAPAAARKPSRPAESDRSRPDPVADSAPVPLGSNAEPTYPPSALRAGASGTVMLNVSVGADGVPTEIAVIERSGNRDLDRAALQAARKWRFAPAIRNGKAVAQDVRVPVEFKTAER